VSARELSAGNEFDQSAIEAFFEHNGAVTAERKNRLEIDQISG
jgi:hypothetical protein